MKVVKGPPAEWGTCTHTVMLKEAPRALACENNVIAVGLESGAIIILDATIGNQTTTLSEHTKAVSALKFSSDGTLLVSGGYDKIINVWDMQTGGIIKTFHGHTSAVLSVSISADCTKVVSGCFDNAMHLWNIQTGECCSTIKFQDCVRCVSFSANPGYLVCGASLQIQQWDIDGYQTGPTYCGGNFAFSPDHTQLVSCDGEIVTVRNFNSGAIVAEFQTPWNSRRCCFSPDGKFIATIAKDIVYVWDIGSSDPCLVGTFGSYFSYLAFASPSSLVLACRDNHIKFWQIGSFTQDLDIPSLNPVLSTPAPVTFVGLQAKDGIAVSCDSTGLIKIWNIITGLCKATYKTPATGNKCFDVQLTNCKLIVIWYHFVNYLWDSKSCGDSQVLVGSSGMKPKLSEDGFKIFLLGQDIMKVVSTETLQILCHIKLEQELEPYFCRDPLYMGDSKVWIHFKDLSIQGWDFESSPPSPILPPHISSVRPCLEFTGCRQLARHLSHYDASIYRPCTIKNTVTEKTVFCLSGKYTIANGIQWDGRYLITGYEDEKILILDFHHLSSL